MNTFLSRLSELGSFVLGALVAVTLACFLSTAFKDRGLPSSSGVPADVRLSRVLLRQDDYAGRRGDLAYVTFDLSADFGPVFDWNVKQLYVYVCAEYATPGNKVNQVVLWDKVLLRGDQEGSRLRLKDVQSKYLFLDDGSGLRANGNVTLTLGWNVVPLAGGALPLVAAGGGGGRVGVPFPDTYETVKVY